MAEITYQKQIIDYAVETDRQYPQLIELKNKSDLAYNILHDNIYYEEEETIPDNYEEIIQQYRNAYNKAYSDFILELERVLKEKEGVQGDVAQ